MLMLLVVDIVEPPLSPSLRGLFVKVADCECFIPLSLNLLPAFELLSPEKNGWLDGSRTISDVSVSICIYLASWFFSLQTGKGWLWLSRFKGFVRKSPSTAKKESQTL